MPENEAEGSCKKRPRHLCSLGTGEVIKILNYESLNESTVESFELTIQGLARCLYSMEASVTDVRVCHPSCGKVVFIITFVSSTAMKQFENGPQLKFEESLKGKIAPSGPAFSTSGTLMPAAHTLSSLLEFLKAHLKGSDFSAHNVRQISKEMERWYPRASEYKQYISKTDCSGYTRNLIYGNEHFDCILMCWPAGSQSTIHDHDESSCWVTLVEGTVHEVQYSLPRLDKKFIEAEQRDPATAVGHCGELRVVNVAKLDAEGCTSTYANNDIGLHRVENRTDELACTLHVYAPPLRKMRVYDDKTGCVQVHVAKCRDCAEDGPCRILDEGYFDVESWNQRLYISNIRAELCNEYGDTVHDLDDDSEDIECVVGVLQSLCGFRCIPTC